MSSATPGDGGSALEAGAFVKAHKGAVCIDELDSESVAVLVDDDGEEIPWSRQRGAVMGASR